MSRLTTFAFPTRVGATPRTIPERLDEVKNVLDFDAVGDGEADDTAAFQAMFDWITSTGYRGRMRIPPGQYKITDEIIIQDATSSLCIKLEGDGGRVSVLVGDFPGFIFNHTGTDNNASTTTIDGIGFINYNAGGGCVWWETFICTEVRDCIFQGFNGFVARTGQNLTLTGCIFWGMSYKTGIGFCGSGTCIGCDFIAWGEAIRTFGQLVVLGGRFEVNGVGITFGKTWEGDDYAAASNLVAGASFEGNVLALDCYHMNCSQIGPIGILSNPFSAVIGGTAAVTSITRVGTVATLVSSVPHGFDEGDVFGLWLYNDGTDIGLGHHSGYSAIGLGFYHTNYASSFYYATATSDPNTMTFTCAGTEPTPSPYPGRWGVPSRSAVRYLFGEGNVFNSVVSGGLFYENAIEFLSPGEGAHNGHVTFNECNFDRELFPVDNWVLPNDTTGITIVGGKNAPAMLCDFAQLPGQAGALFSEAVEGMRRFRVRDAASGKAMGDVVSAGGGSTHYTLEYGGADWRVVGL